MAVSARQYSGLSDVSAPADSAVVITPDDNTDLVNNTKSIYVGGTGNLSVVMLGDGSTVLFSGIPAGAILPIQVKRIRATGTTASLIVALY